MPHMQRTSFFLPAKRRLSVRYLSASWSTRLCSTCVCWTHGKPVILERPQWQSFSYLSTIQVNMSVDFNMIAAKRRVHHAAYIDRNMLLLTIKDENIRSRPTGPQLHNNLFIWTKEQKTGPQRYKDPMLQEVRPWVPETAHVRTRLMRSLCQKTEELNYENGRLGQKTRTENQRAKALALKELDYWSFKIVLHC